MKKKKLPATVLFEKTFDKKFSKVKVELTQLSPELVVDIREWIPSLEDGKLLPSKKGINIPVKNLDELIEYLQEAKKYLPKQ